MDFQIQTLNVFERILKRITKFKCYAIDNPVVKYAAYLKPFQTRRRWSIEQSMCLGNNGCYSGLKVSDLMSSWRIKKNCSLLPKTQTPWHAQHSSCIIVTIISGVCGIVFIFKQDTHGCRKSTIWAIWSHMNSATSFRPRLFCQGRCLRFSMPIFFFFLGGGCCVSAYQKQMPCYGLMYTQV